MWKTILLIHPPVWRNYTFVFLSAAAHPSHHLTCSCTGRSVIIQLLKWLRVLDDSFCLSVKGFCACLYLKIKRRVTVTLFCSTTIIIIIYLFQKMMDMITFNLFVNMFTYILIVLHNPKLNTADTYWQAISCRNSTIKKKLWSAADAVGSGVMLLASCSWWAPTW